MAHRPGPARRGLRVGALLAVLGAGCVASPREDLEWRALAAADRDGARAFAVSRARETWATRGPGIGAIVVGVVVAIVGAYHNYHCHAWQDHDGQLSCTQSGAIALGGVGLSLGGIGLCVGSSVQARPWKNVLGVYRYEDLLPDLRAREADARASGSPRLADHYAARRGHFERWMAGVRADYDWPGSPRAAR